MLPHPPENAETFVWASCQNPGAKRRRTLEG